MFDKEIIEAARVAWRKKGQSEDTRLAFKLPPLMSTTVCPFQHPRITPGARLFLGGVPADSLCAQTTERLSSVWYHGIWVWLCATPLISLLVLLIVSLGQKMYLIAIHSQKREGKRKERRNTTMKADEKRTEGDWRKGEKMSHPHVL